MDKLFRRIIDNNFSELAGLTVNASIPVPEQLINEFIAAAIQGNDNIGNLKVSLHSGNRVSINLKTPLWPWPLDLKLKLESLVDLRDSPKLRARLENKVLLATIGSFLKALPEGIRLHNDLVIVDIASFLSTPEQKRLLRLVRSAGIRMEEGKMILDLEIKLD